MKGFAIVVLALLGGAFAAPQVSVKEGDLADTVESFFEFVKGALPEELKLEDKEIEIPANDVENGKIHITELSLKGLADLTYTVTEEDDEAHVAYTLSSADVVATFNFELDVTGILDSTATVTIEVDLQSINTEGKIAVDADFTEITDLSIHANLGASAITVTGVVDDEYSAFLSKDLTEKVPVVVNQINDALVTPVSDITKFVLNLVLKILS